MSEDPTFLDMALAAAEWGYPVFPVGRNKQPLTKNGFKDATTDGERIRAWWSDLEPWGWGMPMGAVSGLVVLDGDGEEGRKTLEALEDVDCHCHVVTPSGGGHLYVEYPRVAGKTKNSTKFDPGRYPGLDTRCDGGYVVFAAPGYKWQVETFEPEAFGDLPEDVQYAIVNGKASYKRKHGTHNNADSQSGSSGDGYDGSDRLRPPPSEDGEIAVGERHGFLVSEAGRLVNDGKTGNELKLALVTLARERCEDGNADDVAEDIEGIVASAAEWEQHVGGGAGGKDKPAKILVDLCESAGIEFFHDPAGERYATIPVEDHRETYSIDNPILSEWLQGLYYKALDDAISPEQFKMAQAIMRQKAKWDGPEIPVYLRVAGSVAPTMPDLIRRQREEETGEPIRSVVYVDLADAKWRVVKITSAGWEVVPAPDELRFTRHVTTLPLAEPEHGGSLDALASLHPRTKYPLLNVAAEEWPLLAAWLVGALHPSGDFAILGVHGEAGSAKTSLSETCVKLIDPRKPLLSGPPRMGEVAREVMVRASNRWVVAFDNLSEVGPEFANALCRLSTGSGTEERAYYTNANLYFAEAKRTSILNGINEVATDRDDFMDRLIVISTEWIPPERRLTESEFEQAFDPIRGSVQGALYTAVAEAMRTMETVDYVNLPRLGDFTAWAVSAEQSFGFDPGEFATAYQGNRESSRLLVLESEPIAKPLFEFARAEIPVGEQWTGTASSLKAKLVQYSKDTSIPKLDVAAIGLRLNAITGPMRAVGVEIVHPKRTAKARRWIVRYTARLDSQGVETESRHNPSRPSSSALEESLQADVSDDAITRALFLKPKPPRCTHCEAVLEEGDDTVCARCADRIAEDYRRALKTSKRTQSR